jgi:hypothetical protein
MADRGRRMAPHPRTSIAWIRPESEDGRPRSEDGTPSPDFDRRRARADRARGDPEARRRPRRHGAVPARRSREGQSARTPGGRVGAGGRGQRTARRASPGTCRRVAWATRWRGALGVPDLREPTGDAALVALAATSPRVPGAVSALDRPSDPKCACPVRRRSLLRASSRDRHTRGRQVPLVGTPGAASAAVTEGRRLSASDPGADRPQRPEARWGSSPPPPAPGIQPRPAHPGQAVPLVGNTRRRRQRRRHGGTPALRLRPRRRTAAALPRKCGLEPRWPRGELDDRLARHGAAVPPVIPAGVAFGAVSVQIRPSSTNHASLGPTTCRPSAAKMKHCTVSPPAVRPSPNPPPPRRRPPGGRAASAPSSPRGPLTAVQRSRSAAPPRSGRVIDPRWARARPGRPGTARGTCPRRRRSRRLREDRRTPVGPAPPARPPARTAP